MNKEKKLSTIWLDFIIYIFIPFYFLTLTIESVSAFSSEDIIKKISLIVCALYVAFTFCNLIKRNKLSYYLLFIFYIFSLITSCLFLSHRVNITNNIYILEFIGIGIFLWIIPNFIYTYKRRDMFRKHNIAHIKKCPGCNRIIPIHMESCGRCGYKGGENERH